MSHDNDRYTFTQEELAVALEAPMTHCSRCGAWVPATEDGRCGHTHAVTSPGLPAWKQRPLKKIPKKRTMRKT